MRLKSYFISNNTSTPSKFKPPNIRVTNWVLHLFIPSKKLKNNNPSAKPKNWPDAYKNPVDEASPTGKANSQLNWRIIGIIGIIKNPIIVILKYINQTD